MLVQPRFADGRARRWIACGVAFAAALTTATLTAKSVSAATPLPDDIVIEGALVPPQYDDEGNIIGGDAFANGFVVPSGSTARGSCNEQPAGLTFHSTVVDVLKFRNRSAKAQCVRIAITTSGCGPVAGWSSGRMVTATDVDASLAPVVSELLVQPGPFDIEIRSLGGGGCPSYRVSLHDRNGRIEVG